MKKLTHEELLEVIELHKKLFYIAMKTSDGTVIRYDPQSLSYEFVGPFIQISIDQIKEK